MPSLYQRLPIRLRIPTPRRRSIVYLRVLNVQAHTSPWKPKTTRLVLEDGSIWHGAGFGARGTHIAEVVFNTSMTGYQEIMTDPSYKGQFVCFTHPHIGNVGVNKGHSFLDTLLRYGENAEDVESKECHLKGIIVRNLSRTVSNYRATSTLDAYCKENDVVGISELDTRALTRRIREKGSLIGVLCSDPDLDDPTLIEKAQSWKIEGLDLLKEVTTRESYVWKVATDPEWDHNTPHASNGFVRVVAYDFGIKHNILRRLVSHGCDVTVVPADTSAEKVLDMNPDGIFFSNGPGDPSAAPYAVENAKKLIGKKPIFGICMGHQLLGQALGGQTFKLKFGHHGGNHPIFETASGRIEISAQNHNFAIDPDSLPKEVEITHINLNDGTCAGLKHEKLGVMAIQYHPEASPGPHDSDQAFANFVQMMKKDVRL